MTQSIQALGFKGSRGMHPIRFTSTSPAWIHPLKNLIIVGTLCTETVLWDLNPKPVFVLASESARELAGNIWFIG